MVIPQKSVVVGVPAKIIKKTSESHVSDIFSNAVIYSKIIEKIGLVIWLILLYIVKSL